MGSGLSVRSVVQQSRPQCAEAFTGAHFLVH